MNTIIAKFTSIIIPSKVKKSWVLLFHIPYDVFFPCKNI